MKTNPKSLQKQHGYKTYYIHELSLNQTLTINTVYQTQPIITTVIQNIVLSPKKNKQQDKHFDSSPSN